MIDLTIYIILSVSFVFFLMLLRSKSIWEKLMFFNLICVKLLMVITLFAVSMGIPEVLDIAITYSIIGFISLTILSRFLITGGRLK